VVKLSLIAAGSVDRPTTRSLVLAPCSDPACFPLVALEIAGVVAGVCSSGNGSSASSVTTPSIGDAGVLGALEVVGDDSTLAGSTLCLSCLC